MLISTSVQLTVNEAKIPIIAPTSAASTCRTMLLSNNLLNMAPRGAENAEEERRGNDCDMSQCARVRGNVCCWLSTRFYFCRPSLNASYLARSLLSVLRHANAKQCIASHCSAVLTQAITHHPSLQTKEGRKGHKKKKQSDVVESMAIAAYKPSMQRVLCGEVSVGFVCCHSSRTVPRSAVQCRDLRPSARCAPRATLVPSPEAQ
jgi:hypothetical protein